MIELFREVDSPEADWVEAELREMVLGYDRHLISREEAAQRFGNVSLPILRDGAKVASGREDLLTFLRELEQFAEEWRMFQSDSCYVRDDGSNC